MTRFHPLHTHLPLPTRLNNPMGYIPHPLCQQAAREVQQYIASVEEWQEEIGRGKMFGVLVVEDAEGRLGFLAAYSGLLAERNDWPYFVPAVFDFQQPDGYFKREEALIVDINREIASQESAPELTTVREALADARTAKGKDLEEWKNRMTAAKQQRDAARLARKEGHPAEDLPSEATMVQESQWMKAELRRKRKHHEETITALEEKVKNLEKATKQLRIIRKKRSEDLQQWLFSHFEMLNAKGERRNLIDIFASTHTPIPPSGAGECCAPKLLQYAFAHHLRPVAIAEFWWGQSPTGEVRQHRQYYPACRGKCLPILQHMLQGLDVEANTLEQPTATSPTILYEDEALMVVAKPTGMLSVPGKVEGPSVATFAQGHCPEANGPLIVHRLDMATSGLMVIAKTKVAHQHLQAQFHHRTVEKTYIALLERPLPKEVAPKGIISLPLRPDPLDRPRQVVDTVKGKPAVTYYEKLSDNCILLSPKTGRTHQLRVHCAHPDGLGIPIKGDTLYGSPADRLYLHAQSLVFTHPTTGERMTFMIEGFEV